MGSFIRNFRFVNGSGSFGDTLYWRFFNFIDHFLNYFDHFHNYFDHFLNYFDHIHNYFDQVAILQQSE